MEAAEQRSGRGITGIDRPPLHAMGPTRPRCAYLDDFGEPALDAVMGEVEAVAFVFETHMPELLEWLMPGSDAEALLRRLRTGIDACAARRIPFEVAVPFRTETASSLPETVAYLAEAGVQTVRIVPARDLAGRERPLDPFVCFSARYISRLRLLCEERAEAAATRLMWEPRAGMTFALRDLPGFCEEAWGRVTVHADGRITPCLYAAEGELEMGNIATGIESAWRSVEARDLHRAHLTWDYPGACVSCPRVAAAHPAQALPFMARFAAETAEPQVALVALAPEPVARIVSAPTITLARPQEPVERWHLVGAAGGSAHALKHVIVEPSYSGSRAISLPFATEIWHAVEPNHGYWWAVFGELQSGGWAAMQTPRCIVAHEPVPRLSGSRLRYPGDPRRRPGTPAAVAPALGDGEYDELVDRIQTAVRTVVPEGAIAAVVTTGDDRLRELADIDGWHFPRSEDGSFGGFHPADSEWAVSHLNAMRAAGAQYLVLPETAWWWHDEYPAFVTYLREQCALVLEEPGICIVVSLEKKPA